MRKVLSVFLMFVFLGGDAFCVRADVHKSSKRNALSGRGNRGSKNTTAKIQRFARPTATTSTSSSATDTENKEEKTFSSCMDNICKSDSAEEKGRCRCSSQLSRIEKILRDIERVQNEADAQNKSLENLMNVSNTTVVDDSVGNIYNNINSIEKKAKTMASDRIDSKTLVAEGYPLYKKAYEECQSYLPQDNTEKNTKEKEYQTMIESDCSAYTSILKEKADTAQNLLVQAQKNQEMFDEQQQKQLNQLDTSSCYVEYETCMKTQCGEGFKFCQETAKLEAHLKKCESINYGKCEDNKVVVIKDLRKTISKALEKEKIAQSCIAALGHIVSGKCLFKVKYVAERCTIAKKCGDSQEKQFNPGESFYCDDSKGPFKELVLGCKESCYLIGSRDEEKYLGNNKSFLCQKPDRVTLPIPEGWGSDGFPVNEELKNAF